MSEQVKASKFVRQYCSGRINGAERGYVETERVSPYRQAKWESTNEQFRSRQS